MKKLYLYLAAVMLLACASCSDDDPSNGPLPEDWTSQALPTDDQLKSNSDAAVALYGEYADDQLAVALLNRFKTAGFGAVGGSTTSTIVIDNDIAGTLTSSECEDIVLSMLDNRNIVVVKPTLNGWNKLAENLANAYKSLIERMELPTDRASGADDFLAGIVRDIEAGDDTKVLGIPLADKQGASGDDEFANILAVRGNKVRCCYGDSEFDKVTVTEETREYDKNGNLASTTVSDPQEVSDSNAKLTDYQVGLLADDLVEWINEWNNPDDTTSPVTSSESDLKSLMDAQEYTESFISSNSNATSGKDGSHYQSRSCTVNITYYIWSIYDFNKDKDYYLIHQVINSHNGELGVTTGKRGWDSTTSDWVYLGAWAFNVSTDIKMVDIDFNEVANVRSSQVEPTTREGSVSHTTGISYNVSGNIGFNMSGLTGGASGGVTFSDSYTTTIPDYNTEEQSSSSGSALHWNYIAGNARVEGHYSKNSYEATHDIIPSCYRNDCIFNQSWIYEVSKPHDKYYLSVTTQHQLGWYKGKNTWFYMTDKYYTQTNSHSSHLIKLNEPVRAKKDWYMDVTTSEGVSNASVRQFLANRYTRFWKESFVDYEFTATSTIGIDEFINDFKQEIFNDLQAWKSAGFYGNFSITFRPASSKDNYKTIDFYVSTK